MRPARSWILAAIIAATVPCVAPTSVQAQPEELTTQQARALFQEALALVAAGDYPSALKALQRVASFKRTPQVLFNIGLCHEKTGMLVMALGEYRIALADGQVAGAKDVVAEATAAIAKLEPRIPMLTINKGTGAQFANITVDGKELGASAIDEPIPVDPGTRVVVGQAAGYQPFRQEVKLGEGEKVSVEVQLEKRAEVAPVAPPTRTDKPQRKTASLDTREGRSNTFAWIATGVGVAGLGASAYFFAQRSKAIADLDDLCVNGDKACPASAQSTYDDGKRNTLLGNVAVSVGVVGVVTGMILFASSGSGAGDEPTQPNKPGVAVRVVPSSTGSWTGMSLDGRF